MTPKTDRIFIGTGAPALAAALMAGDIQAILGHIPAHPEDHLPIHDRESDFQLFLDNFERSKRRKPQPERTADPQPHPYFREGTPKPPEESEAAASGAGRTVKAGRNRPQRAGRRQ